VLVAGFGAHAAGGRGVPAEQREQPLAGGLGRAIGVVLALALQNGDGRGVEVSAGRERRELIADVVATLPVGSENGLGVHGGFLGVAGSGVRRRGVHAGGRRRIQFGQRGGHGLAHGAGVDRDGKALVTLASRRRRGGG